MRLLLAGRKAVAAALIITATIAGCTAPPGAAPPSYGAFEKLVISDISPEGWIKTFLERQRDGLTGHIEAAGYPYDTCGWACDEVAPSMKKWWPYEQTSYYIDGAHRLGYLLDDDSLIAVGRRQIEYVVSHADSVAGRLGPLHVNDEWWRWPYATFFRTFMTEYSVSGDQALVDALHRHYLTFSAYDFADDLEMANLEELCWLYERTGDERLLDMAEDAYALFLQHEHYRDRGGWRMNFATDEVPTMHAVVYLELVKIPAILYAHTGNRTYLEHALNGLDKLVANHMLISGLPSSTEHMQGIDERAGHETCNTAAFPYAVGYVLRASGDARWADRIERAVFNAGIGAVNDDFTALQYFSCPNQTIATLTSNHLGHHPGRLAFSPGHDVECCTGNVNRFMPYYVEQMWLRAADEGLVAALYGPSSVSFDPGLGQGPVTVHQRTDYPFSDRIEFEFEVEDTATFPFHLRIPGWTANARVLVNGEPVGEAPRPGSFYRIDRRFADGDRVTLIAPQSVSVTNWPNQGLGIERGPLAFSYPIDALADVVATYVARGKPRSTPAFPAYELRPATPWNLGLPSTLNADDVEVVDLPSGSYPWTRDLAPVRLRVPARRVIGWIVPVDTTTGEPQAPHFPASRTAQPDVETIDLLPYGVTALRLSVFPAVDPK